MRCTEYVYLSDTESVSYLLTVYFTAMMTCEARMGGLVSYVSILCDVKVLYILLPDYTRLLDVCKSDKPGSY